MIFTVGVVVVDRKAFVDPRLDTSTAIIRDIFSRTAHDQDTFEILTVHILPQNEEDINSTVRNLLERDSVDWIIVVGGIGFEDGDCTPEAIEPFIQRPAIAIVNRILANVQDPFLIRPSAGASGRTLIVTLPGDTEDLQKATTWLITSAPGFVRLLKLLKTGQVTSNQASGSIDTRRINPAALDSTPGQVSPNTSSSPSASVSARGPYDPPVSRLKSPWRRFIKAGREALDDSTDDTHRGLPSTSRVLPATRVSRLIEPSESETVVPRTLAPGTSAASETPWRCFEIRPGANITAPNYSKQGNLSSATVPEATVSYSCLTASPQGELYMFGGFPSPRGLFRLELDTRNSIATIRNVQAAGTVPSTRWAPAVWISRSLMVIWGGLDAPLHNGAFDPYLYVFNTENLTWTTLSTAGPGPDPRAQHAMVAVGQKIYMYGGCHERWTSLSDFWCLDFSVFLNPQRRSNAQWQNLSGPLDRYSPIDLPGEQRHHHLIACGDNIMLLDVSLSSFDNSAVYCYSIKTSQWKRCCNSGLGKITSEVGAVLQGDTIYSYNGNNCQMFSTSNNIWLENPSTYSRDGLTGSMTTIGSKIYVLGKSPSNPSKLALFELDPENIWLPTQAEYAIAQALRD